MRSSLLALPLALGACGAMPEADPAAEERAGDVQRLFTQGCYLAEFDEGRSRAVFRQAGLEEERITNASVFTSEDGNVQAFLARFSQPGGNGQQCRVGALGIPIASVNGLAIRLVEEDGGPEGTAEDRRARDGIAILGFDDDAQAVAISTSRESGVVGTTDFVTIEMTRVTQ